MLNSLKSSLLLMSDGRLADVLQVASKTVINITNKILKLLPWRFAMTFSVGIRFL